MAGHYAFAYFMKPRPQSIREIAPYHVDYWREAQAARCLAGPFSDKSGGLITFEASCLEEAETLVEQDPYVVHALLAHWWIKEWIAPFTRAPASSAICRRRRHSSDEKGREDR